MKAVSGTSSDTGSTATVDRLEAGLPAASHLLPGVCRARLRAGRTLHTEYPQCNTGDELPERSLDDPTCQRAVNLLEDLLPQQVDQSCDHLYRKQEAEGVRTRAWSGGGGASGGFEHLWEFSLDGTQSSFRQLGEFRVSYRVNCSGSVLMS